MEKVIKKLSNLLINNNIFYTLLFIITTTLILILTSRNIKSKTIYNLTASKETNYNVILNDNSFYDNINPKTYYPTSAIKDYNLNFIYNLKSTQNLNLIYTYNITASIIGKVKNKYGEMKNVWERNFILQEDTTNNVFDNNFLVNKSINIDYNYYKNLVKDYEKNYGILIDAILNVKFNINYNSYNSKYKLENNFKDYIELAIPLTDEIISINENYDTNTINNIKVPTKNNNIQYVIIILLIITLLILIFNKILNTKKTPVQIYRHKVNYILKNYKNIIITVKNKINLSNLSPICLDNFDNIISIAEQNNCNIIYYEAIKDKESIFYAIVNNYVYIYIITKSK